MKRKQKAQSRQKGATGEREFAAELRRYGYKARRGQQYCGLEGEDVVAELPIDVHFEVKRTERLRLPQAMDQAREDAREGAIPVVAHRRNYDGWQVTMYLDHWLDLVRKAENLDK